LVNVLSALQLAARRMELMGMPALAALEAAAPLVEWAVKEASTPASLSKDLIQWPTVDPPIALCGLESPMRRSLEFPSFLNCSVKL